jgi:hypothetical protein
MFLLTEYVIDFLKTGQVTKIKKKTKLRGFSLQVNYTDWVTGACRLS